MNDEALAVQSSQSCLAKVGGAALLRLSSVCVVGYLSRSLVAFPPAHKPKTVDNCVANDSEGTLAVSFVAKRLKALQDSEQPIHCDTTSHFLFVLGCIVGQHKPSTVGWRMNWSLLFPLPSIMR